MLNGQKTMTSRTKRYGNVGDTFDVFGATFELTDVSKMTLQFVAYGYYQEEGCQFPTDFIDIWERIHPRKGYVPNQVVHTHFFKRIR